MGPAEFFFKYWEWCLLAFLILNTIFQKLEWKGAQDILGLVWSGIKSLVVTKPGKLPMLFIGLSLLIPSLVLASDVTFEWDSNTENDMAYYNIYRSGDAQATWNKVNPVPINHIGSGMETWTECGVGDGTYHWYGTAVDTEGNESDPSNMVTATIDATPPAPPSNFIVSLILKIIAWIKGLFSGSFALA